MSTQSPKPSAPHVPHVPASESPPEITIPVVALSITLAMVLGAANAYLGLFAGMTVSASIPAAVISMALLRALGGNILQNNAVQTAASAGESLAAGVIFTMPAMIILGAWSRFSYLETTAIAGLGGLLGVMFTIPLRRALIVEQPLQFPEGVATAEVLKVGEAGGAAVKHIAVAGLIGALFKLGTTGMKLWEETAGFATKIAGGVFSIGTNLSPALVAVGFIVRLNIAALIFFGGALNWLVAIPIVSASMGIPDGTAAADAAGGIWSSQTRYLGVGAMLVGGLWALIRLRAPLVKGIKASLAAYKQRGNAGAEAIERTDREIPMNIVLIIVCVAAIPVFILFEHFTHDYLISALMTVFVLVAGFLFSAVAAYMAGLVGSSNNPISGVTIATVLTAALLLVGLGLPSEVGPAAAILIGGVVCCAAAIGGDNMQDLKAGHIVGSTPYRQQIMQVVGVIAAALVVAPVLNLLHTSYVIGGGLKAPQASLMAAVAKGTFFGGLPWKMIGIGAAIAVAVIIVDLILESRKSAVRAPVLAFAVGIYLPFELSVPILFGGLVAWAMGRALAARNADDEEKAVCERNGLLYAAGIITGEALIGIGLAIPVAATGDINVLAVFGAQSIAWPGLVLLGVVIIMMFRVSTKRETT